MSWSIFGAIYSHVIPIWETWEAATCAWSCRVIWVSWIFQISEEVQKSSLLFMVNISYLYKTIKGTSGLNSMFITCSCLCAVAVLSWSFIDLTANFQPLLAEGNTSYGCLHPKPATGTTTVQTTNKKSNNKGKSHNKILRGSTMCLCPPRNWNPWIHYSSFPFPSKVRAYNLRHISNLSLLS